MIIDVSYAQGFIDWKTVMQNPEIEGVWIRASHGSQRDSKFTYNALAAHAYKRPDQWIGYYHFAEYGPNEGAFRPALPFPYKPDRLCIDVEGKIPPTVVNWLVAQLAYADNLVPGTWLYSYDSEATKLFNSFPLRNWWVARVGPNGAATTELPTIKDWALQQYSWVEHIPGITQNVCDVSRKGPAYPGGSTSVPTQTGAPLKILVDPKTNSAWELDTNGGVKTLRGHTFYGAWGDVPSADRGQSGLKSFFDFSLRPDGQPGYTIWILTVNNTVSGYDFPIKKG